MREYSYFVNDDNSQTKNNCIFYANRAHNLYFDGDKGNRSKLVKNKIEFIKASDNFLKSIKKYMLNKFNTSSMKYAANKIFDDKNPIKARFFLTEFYGVEKRIRILLNNPNLINNDNIFILEHTARFMEVLLPNTFACYEQVEKNNKFSDELKEIAKREFHFFEYGKIFNNDYLHSFYECAYISQKSINSFLFIIDYLRVNYGVDSNNDHVVKDFFRHYGSFDYKSNLIFSRLSLEHFLKYLNLNVPGMWEKLADIISENLTDLEKKKFINNKDINTKSINTPIRIEALENLGIIDKLMANEMLLVNSRGNNVAHNGIPGLFSTCYHNLEVLNYLYKYYR